MKEKFRNANWKRLIKKDKSILLGILLITIVMALCASGHGKKIAVADSKENKALLESLDQKREKVMNLTAIMTATSIAVSAIPDDTATPLAEKIMDLTTYMIWVLGVLMIEKYTVVLFQYVGWKILIPIGILALGIGVSGTLRSRMKNRSGDVAKKVGTLGVKLLLIGLIMAKLVTWSEGTSSFIYDTYAVSIEETMENAEKASEAYDNAEDEDTGWWEKIQNKFGEVVDTLTGAVDWAKDTLNDFVEATVVMLVTCCIIPVITVLLFIILIKWLVGVDFSYFSTLPSKRN